MIYGALAYFILPIDTIPDVIPVVGYADDRATLSAAMFAVFMYRNNDIKAQASQKLSEWFD